ncbi:nucleosome assembly protein [Apostichopus japonicus]|uniref:Nucleosome assembly protein n=1 Tax=Stichopus japonicus TaxID=307972 RepID=A0A2G8L074_STIJA|nr:nucleosome assembly protein [Apostichopus japonicus]
MADTEKNVGAENASSDAVIDLEAGAQGDANSEEMDTVDIKDEKEKATLDLKKQVLQNPQVLAALQDRLDSLVGQRSGYIDFLPPAVKRRIKALKNYQVKQIQLEAKFYEEVHQLECKYAKLYEECYDKRKDVVTGSVEPTDSDCEWESSDDEDEDGDGEGKEVKALAEEVKSKITFVDNDNKNGIPEFWLTIFKNVDILAEMIQDHDEPILKHLEDIKVIFQEGSEMGFTLDFYFTPNEFFNNKVLTKRYEMKSEPDEGDPFSFEGPEIVGAKGCKIDWKKGKDVTVKIVKKKQKHKGRGTTRQVTKTVTNDSFFNFFKPPEIPEDEADLDDETEALLSADFEIGHMIRERIVPRAVLYFTGEAIEDDDEYEEEGEEEEGEGEDDEDEENDPDFDPSKVRCDS